DGRRIPAWHEDVTLHSAKTLCGSRPRSGTDQRRGHSHDEGGHDEGAEPSEAVGCSHTHCPNLDRSYASTPLLHRRCLPGVHPREARYFSPTARGSSSSGVPIVSFQRLRKPNTAITPTISTICSSVQCLRSSVNISSVTAFGTEPAATATS